MLRSAALMLFVAVAVAVVLGAGVDVGALTPSAHRVLVAPPDATLPPAPATESPPGDVMGGTPPTNPPTSEPERSPVEEDGDDEQPDTTRPETTVPTDTQGDEPSATSSPDGTAALRPSSSPQVRSSDIPLGSTILAVLVLGGVGVASFRLVRREQTSLSAGRGSGDVEWPFVSEAEAVPAPQPTADGNRAVAETIDFLLGLGESLIDAGDAVSHVEATLRAVARVNGVGEVGVIVLPTALIVSVPGDRNVETEVSTAGRTALRLDQIDDVLTLVGEAERGHIDAKEGQRRLAEIRASDPPSTRRLALVGYACATVGLALVLHASWREVLLAALLGAVIGSLRLSTKRLGSSYQPFIPLIAATTVSITVFALARIIDDMVTFPLLVAPLITFLPGAVLTMAVLELATGQIVSGASRLASGAMQLVLLAVGVVAGGQLVGVPTGDLRGDFDGTLAVFGPWIGVGIFGVGVVWFNGARSTARRWILLVLYVAFAGQVIGGLFFGSALSAFFGAIAMTPVAILASRQPTGPTPLVLFLPGFWILVPGALGLEGVARLLGDDGGAGLSAVVTTVTSMVGISLGILLGLIASTSDPEHPWMEVDAADRDVNRDST